MSKVSFILVVTTIMSGGEFYSGAATQQLTTLNRPADERSETCRIHKLKMVRGSVPVRFGRVLMYNFDDHEQPERSKLVHEYLRVKEELFPETHRWLNGGCDPSFWGFQQSTTVYYCKTCRRLEDEWFAKHLEFLSEDRKP